MNNFYLYREILTGAWHIDAGTFITYYPMAMSAIQGKLLFAGADEEQASKPFTVSAGQINTSATSQEKYIKVIPIRGIILRDDAMCGPVGTRTLANRLKSADAEQNNIGTILLIDSGGGQAIAVPDISEAISECKKPVVAFVDGMACSAAYYIASYCKEVIANRDNDYVGCIGTMISMNAPKIGATDTDGNTHIRIYADGADEKNDEFEQALEGNYKLIKERVLNPHNEQFKADVRANRPNVTEAHLKGRTFEAKDVLGVLVDSIGNLDHAANRILELAESDEYKQNENQSNFLNMSKFPNLLAALGITELAVVDGHTSLNEEQLSAIENALANTNSDTEALEQANATITERDQTIQQLSDKIKVLEKKPGAESASVVMDTDAGGGEQTSVYEEVRNILKGGRK